MRSIRASACELRFGCLPLLAAMAVGCGSSGGSSGTPGAAGTTGGAGTSGHAGSTGTAGTSGGAGTTGTAGAGTGGTSGAAATTGAAGTSAAGTSGGAGTTGTAGAGGRGGTTGAAGTSGSAGASGRGGTTGAAGTTGSAGTTGKAGATGTAGAAGAMPSSGCSAATTPAGGTATIDVSGTSREYILTLPATYDPKHPYPLLFAFHGGMYDDQWVVSGGAPQTGPYYGIQAAAHDTMILIAPNALTGSWTNQNGRDIAFVNAMVSRFESQLCVDQSRIFAAGFSFGAIMTIAVGCNASSTFRAIAAMSGEIMNGCPDTRPMPYWASHGMSDTTIDISNGEAARDTYIQRNHCTTQTTPGSPTGCVNYQGCDPGYPVIWCPFAGMHEPPSFAGTAIFAYLSQF
jgi:hypothetical protein